MGYDYNVSDLLFNSAINLDVSLGRFHHRFIGLVTYFRSLPPDRIFDQATWNQRMADLKTLEDFVGVVDGQWQLAHHRKALQHFLFYFQANHFQSGSLHAFHKSQMSRSFELYFEEDQDPVESLHNIFSFMDELFFESYKIHRRFRVYMLYMHWETDEFLEMRLDEEAEQGDPTKRLYPAVDSSPAAKNKLEKRFRESGRSWAQARQESNIFSRLVGLISYAFGIKLNDTFIRPNESLPNPQRPKSRRSKAQLPKAQPVLYANPEMVERFNRFGANEPKETGANPALFLENLHEFLSSKPRLI